MRPDPPETIRLRPSTPSVARDDSAPSETPNPESQRYEPRDLLGRGGMGEVHQLFDRRVGRHVALKTLRPDRDDREQRMRFLREARVQGQLEHPAVVPVYDLGEDVNGRPFFTMRRVRGHTLDVVLAALARRDPEYTGRFSTRRLLSAFARLCLAVDYAHERGVVHRDIKPANVMLGDHGEVYLLDWGLARLVDQDLPEPPREARVSGPEVDGMTAADAVVGTPGYLAPEQLEEATPGVDARADVYALGVTLWEILTQRKMREGSAEAMMLQALEVAPRVSSVAPDVAPELDALCAAALAVKPDARIPDARTLAEGVERFLDGERDLSMRRELSAGHTRAAAAGSSRTDALREVLQALALDPSNRDAQGLLVRWITDDPDEVVPEAAADLEATDTERRLVVGRIARWGFMCWLAAAPLALIAGVRVPWVIALGSASTLGAFGVTVWAQHRRETSRLMVFTLAAMVCVTVMCVTGLLGPFVLAPTMASSVAMAFATYAPSRDRRWLTVMLVAATLIPFGLEELGWVPRAWKFTEDGITLFARAVRLPERLTVGFFAYSSATFVAFPAILFGRLRDVVERGERRRFMHAWHLRRLFPEATRDTRSGEDSQ